MEQMRYTLDGSDALEHRLDATCKQILSAITQTIPSQKLEAILLAGGYGRGEGGVLKTPQGDCPYNDLEFYVCLSGNRLLNERNYGKSMHQLGERLSPDAGLDVEFKLFSLGKLRKSPITMFYYDLIMGHRWLFGTESLLEGCDHHRDASSIPLHEATRLLMNRCSGLLFSAERLQRNHFTNEDADFVGRNLAKAQLAFGDVVLTASHQYHWSCRERNRRLKELNLQSKWPEIHSICQHHDIGVEFKLHPYRANQSADQLRTLWEELCGLGRSLWLSLESIRLGHSIPSILDYILSYDNLCPENSAIFNWLVNGKTFQL
jgi:hypothetical protein